MLVAFGYVTTAPFTLFSVVLAVAVTLAGHTTLGACVSFTVTVKLLVAVLPDASVAVYTTVVVPTGKIAPDACVDVNVGLGQLSVVVAAVQLTTAEQLFASVPLVMFDGVFTITGASVSFTVTVKLHVAVPQILVAVTVTVVTPLLNIDPLPSPDPEPVVAPLNV